MFLATLIMLIVLGVPASIVAETRRNTRPYSRDARERGIV